MNIQQSFQIHNFGPVCSQIVECYYQYHRYCPGGLVAVFFDQGHRRDQDHDFGAWSYYLFLAQFLANFWV